MQIKGDKQPIDFISLMKFLSLMSSRRKGKKKMN